MSFVDDDVWLMLFVGRFDRLPERNACTGESASWSAGLMAGGGFFFFAGVAGLGRAGGPLPGKDVTGVLVNLVGSFFV